MGLEDLLLLPMEKVEDLREVKAEMMRIEIGLGCILKTLIASN